MDKQDVSFDAVDLDPRLSAEIGKLFVATDKVLVGPKKFLLPTKYRREGPKHMRFRVRPDDVWVTGIPRSGSTMTQELIWLILNDVDLEKAKEIHALERIPYFEGNTDLEDAQVQEIISKNYEGGITDYIRKRVAALDILEATKGRRVIQSHLPLSLLPEEVFTKGCTVFYLARNPKDVIVSSFFLYHVAFVKRDSYLEDFGTYFQLYRKGLVNFTPYYSHVKEAWEMRNQPNFRLIFYEDFTANLREYVEEISSILQKSLSPQQLDQLETLLHFDNFKKYKRDVDPAVNNDSGVQIVRRGKSGGWREHFKGDINEEANQWIRENLEETGIEYPESLMKNLYH